MVDDGAEGGNVISVGLSVMTILSEEVLGRPRPSLQALPDRLDRVEDTGEASPLPPGIREDCGELVETEEAPPPEDGIVDVVGEKDV